MPVRRDYSFELPSKSRCWRTCCLHIATIKRSAITTVCPITPVWCRLDTLRKVVPHRDRANTAAFLEEVISYVVGLKKRVADLEGVSEDKISVPQVDVGGMLNGGAANGGTATVLGNPTIPAVPPTANGTDTMQLAMLDGMGGQPMPVSGPIMAGMPFQDAAAPDLSKGLGAPARGMPTPALNANQARPWCLIYACVDCRIPLHFASPIWVAKTDAMPNCRCLSLSP